MADATIVRFPAVGSFEDVTTTDDVTVGDDLVVTDDASAAEFIVTGVTGVSDLSALRTGTAHPVTPGVAAAIGTKYIQHNGSGTIQGTWLKYASGDTAWYRTDGLTASEYYRNRAM